MVFEDATIELNNVYGWKRHNAQCQKIGHVLQILTHQYFSQNKAHSIIAQNNVLSFKYIDYVIPILYR